MWNFISNITITCFALSYLIALVLEISQLYFRLPARHPLTIAMTLVGGFAHSAFLIARSSSEVAGRFPLSNWYDGCLIIAWIIIALYVVNSLKNRATSMGLFLLPSALILIALPASGFFDPHQSASANAKDIWSIIHGSALLIGTLSVLVGFSGALMYLIQSNRLKRKLPPLQGFNLPSLEKLSHINERSLIVSSIFIAAGLLSGMILNVYRASATEIVVPWRDPLVWTSSLVIGWVVVVTLFNRFYKPARVGRKVAYLALANFCIFGLTLYILLSGLSEHSSKSLQDAAHSQEVDL